MEKGGRIGLGGLGETDVYGVGLCVRVLSVMARVVL